MDKHSLIFPGTIDTTIFPHTEYDFSIPVVPYQLHTHRFLSSILRMIRSTMLSYEIRYSPQTHLGVVIHNTRLGFIPQSVYTEITVFFTHTEIGY